MEPDQAQHFVGPDLVPKCLQRLYVKSVSLAWKELKSEIILSIMFNKCIVWQVLKKVLTKSLFFLAINDFYKLQRNQVNDHINDIKYYFFFFFLCWMKYVHLIVDMIPLTNY